MEQENLTVQQEILNEEGTLQHLISESQKAVDSLQTQYSTLVENLVEIQQLLSGRPSLQKKYKSQVEKLAKQVKEFEERGQTESTSETTVGDSSASSAPAETVPEATPPYQASEPPIAWDDPDEKVATKDEGSGENNDPILKGMEQDQQAVEAKAIQIADETWNSFAAYDSEFFSIKSLFQRASYSNVWNQESARVREILKARIEENQELVIQKFESATLWSLYYSISTLNGSSFQIESEKKKKDRESLFGELSEFPGLESKMREISVDSDQMLEKIKMIKTQNPKIIAPFKTKWETLVAFKQAIQEAMNGKIETIYNIAKTRSGINIPSTVEEIKTQFAQLRASSSNKRYDERVLEVTEISGSEGSAFSQMRSQRPEQRQEGMKLVNEQCVVVPEWYLTRNVKQKIAEAVADGLGIDGFGNRQSRSGFIQSIIDDEPKNILSGYSGGKQYFVREDQEIPGDLNMLIVGRNEQTGRWSTMWKRMYYPTS